MPNQSKKVILPTIEHDPYVWLEAIEDEKALAWVREQNQYSQTILEALPNFEAIRKHELLSLDSEDKIPFISKQGKWYYNFWKDTTHVRGLWRRTTLESYRTLQPDWETVLDLDKLAEDEQENWVWQGAVFLEPEYERCLMHLSRGGSDANVIREFDAIKKSFISDGFFLPESKGGASYRNSDSLLVGRDFGEGSLTTAGYPRVVKYWQRGTSLGKAEVVLEGKPEDMGVYAYLSRVRGIVHEIIERRPTFWTNEIYLRRAGELIKLEVPEDAYVAVFAQWLTLDLKSPYEVAGKTYPTGALLVIDLEAFLQGQRNFDLLFEPAERTVLDSWIVTQNYLVLNVSANLERKLYTLKYENAVWIKQELESPIKGSVTIWAEDDEASDYFFLEGSDYLTPSSLFYGDAEKHHFEKLKQAPHWYDSSKFVAEKFETKSKDGETIPYFVIHRKDISLDSKNPTLLYGYGGFEISKGPMYKSATWLDYGGIWVDAVLRGGGEFGPDWHWAATKENKQRTFDDFIAIAEDLIKRGFTSPEHLGIMGGSNGGLLMGAMLTQ
jgi:prolyl oligopeptidase